MFIVAEVKGKHIYAHSATLSNKEIVKINVSESMIEMGYTNFDVVESEVNPFSDE